MIVLYVLKECPYCQNALAVLAENKIKHKAIIVKNTEEEKAFYKKQNGMTTFPQIFMKISGDNFMKIGGSADLMEIVEISQRIKDSSVSLDSIYYFYQLMNRS